MKLDLSLHNGDLQLDHYDVKLVVMCRHDLKSCGILEEKVCAVLS